MGRSEDEDNLDSLFRDSLIFPEPEEIEEDWEDMKGLLLRKKRSRSLWYNLILVAGLVFVFLSLSLLLTSQQQQHSSNNPVKKATPAEVVKNNNNNQPALRDIQSTSKNRFLEQLDAYKAEEGPMILTDFRTAKMNDDTPTQIKYNKPAVSDYDSTLTIASNIDDSGDTAMKLANAITVEHAEIRQPDSSAINPDKTKQTNLSVEKLTLSLAISPDFSGINYFRNTRIGYSLSASILYSANKITIGAGVAYGSKIYETAFSNYKPDRQYMFPAIPKNVKANCQVLDFPLNLAYTFFKKNSNTLSLSTGLSSYFMLKEKYVFGYENAYTKAPRIYVVDNQNRHYLGVANFGINYQKVLRGNTSILFGPYLKVPLTGIGYGNMKLKSTGISIGMVTGLKRYDK